MKKIAYVGIDYHLNSLSLAVVVKGKNAPVDMVRLKNDDKLIRKYMSKLSEKFEIKACYEASSNGYSFQRKMAAWGYPCEVIAPSLIPRKPGDHRKNDFRDARDLAQNYAHGTLSIVHPPTEEEEAVRSLDRCRFAFKEAAKRFMPFQPRDNTRSDKESDEMMYRYLALPIRHWPWVLASKRLDACLVRGSVIKLGEKQHGSRPWKPNRLLFRSMLKPHEPSNQLR